MKMLKTVLAAVFVFAAVGTISAQSPLQDVNVKFNEAVSATNAKDYVKAVTLFEQVIDEGLDVEGAEGLVTSAKATLPNVVFRSGMVQAQQGKFDDAIATLSRAAEMSELYGVVAVLNNARTALGQVVIAQGANAFNNKDYAAAATIFRKGYDANPNNIDVALYLARSYSGLKEFDKSGEIYKNIIALDGRDARYDAAVATAKENFTLDNLEKASGLAQAGDFQGAVDVADAMLAVLPDNAAAQMTRLQAYMSLKNYARVIELGDATIAAQGADEVQTAAANYLVGIAYNNTENAARAITYLGRVNAGPNAAAAKAMIPELQKVVASGK
jgi:tetratricopeptide (TPR) repeat protein